jgi:hypothetical protein
MKRLCSALLVLAMAGCSGVDVQGIVRDERTGEPLPGATVKIGDEETATDYRGFFELEVDEDEASKMHVNKSGYETYTESVSFDDDMDEVIQDVELAPQGSGMPSSDLEGSDELLPPGGSTEGLNEDGSMGTQPQGTQPGTQPPPAGWSPKEPTTGDELNPEGSAPRK